LCDGLATVKWADYVPPFGDDVLQVMPDAADPGKTTRLLNEVEASPDISPAGRWEGRFSGLMGFGEPSRRL
jgi:hypothetical protein